MMRISLAEAANAVHGKLIHAAGAEEKNIQRVEMDSRLVEAGTLFVALSGGARDGHDFIPMAAKAGALAVLCEKDCMADLPAIVVEDSKAAMQRLAAYCRNKWQFPVIGVTGSVGKTSTKDMIASVLQQKYRTHATMGNYNNNLGVPLTIFAAPEDTQAAVVEMGMNHFGEMHLLSSIVRPDIAVISNIGIAHIENLGSREGILKAKCEIFDFMTEQGEAILLQDGDLLSTLKGKLKQHITWYGIAGETDVTAKDICPNGLLGTYFKLCADGKEIPVALPVAGIHMVQNALAAAAAGLKMGLTLEEIRTGLERFSLTKNRMDVIHGPITIINDTYNANPVSVMAALDVLGTVSGRKVAILGDMGELGEQAEALHYETGAHAAQAKVDVVIAIGELAHAIYEGAKTAGAGEVYHYPSQELLWEDLNKLLQKGDTVLVKASHAMALEKTVEKIQGVEEK